MPTGINTENLAIVLEKLQNAIGKQWVSDDPAHLASYSRDFTIVPGRWPNIVVLPGSTEDVQKIIKIAAEHEVPVVPMSTGFNHGGLCIPLHGGIMVDLIKRMDKVLNLDEETLTITIQPGVRNAVTYAMANHRCCVDDVPMAAAVSLSMGSTSTLANYIGRGIPGSEVKYGDSTEAIVGMTWVLPDGEILKTGTPAVPNVGIIPIAYGPGPDIGGMFINASGMFGICTEITIKLFPEKGKERLYIFDAKVKERSLEKALEFLIQLSQQALAEFIYKSHGGQTVNMIIDPDNPYPPGAMCEFLPEDPVIVSILGETEEELDIKEEILMDLAAECGLYALDMKGLTEQIFKGAPNPFERKARSQIGKAIGSVLRRGAFQWYSCNVKADPIPEMASKFFRLVEKYWKPTDPKISRHATMSGTDIQGPHPFARNFMFEVDFWWDQANPEDVKRAAVLLRKTGELILEHGAQPWRNMYRHGELHLPRLGTYLDILKQTKREFDPNNLMHPDIEPVTDDYI